MASVPPRRASQRRSSPSEAETSQSQPLKTNDEVASTVSEDSQTILLNSPSQKPENQPALEELRDEGEASAAPSRQVEEDDVRKCWICFSDETEDTPVSSEWRSPCPCALVAHEECLLDWIADMEAPTSRQRAGASREIRCPQCKAEIHVSKPRSLIVEAARQADDWVGDLVLPWGAVLVAETIHSISFVHGTATIFAIFGREDAGRILKPFVDALQSWSWQGTATLFREHWRLPVGIPLIPGILILSRTGGSVADSLLPIIPVLFFATSARSEDLLLRPTWPPSATMAFAMLPYVRSAYKGYLEVVWGKWERQWLKEILPRSTQSENDANGEQDLPPPEVGEGILDINVGIVEEWDEDEPQDEEHQAGPQLEQEGEQQGGIAPAPLPQEGDAAVPDAVPADGAPAPENNRRREGRRFDIQLSKVLDTVLGALAFPGIAAAMGGLLKITLPRTLTTFVPGRAGQPTGLLQTRWGRSIVGGCLFVALKDAMLLYVRWRMAQNHRERKIRNYDKVLKKLVDAPEHTRTTL